MIRGLPGLRYVHLDGFRKWEYPVQVLSYAAGRKLAWDTLQIELDDPLKLVHDKFHLARKRAFLSVVRTHQTKEQELEAAVIARLDSCLLSNIIAFATSLVPREVWLGYYNEPHSTSLIVEQPYLNVVDSAAIGSECLRVLCTGQKKPTSFHACGVVGDGMEPIFHGVFSKSMVSGLDDEKYPHSPVC